MTRLLLSLAGVVLLAVVALGVMWLAGQLLVGAGVVALGTAGVLLRLLWFLLVAGGLGGLVYFVANAWRPAHNSTYRAIPQTTNPQATEPQTTGPRPVTLPETVTHLADLSIKEPDTMPLNAPHAPVNTPATALTPNTAPEVNHVE